MPRPKCQHKVCVLPETNLFGPLISDLNKQMTLIMTVEEYEAVRIIDLNGKSQEECAIEMDVSRPTLQRVYYNAKRKIADAIVNGKVLKIEGGNYRLCDKLTERSHCGPCPNRFRKKHANSASDRKGETT